MQIRYLSGADDPAFDAILRIYHASFDRASREPDERLVAEARGEYRLPFRFLLAESEDRVLGFARFCRLPESGHGLLIHIAADPLNRGHGVGSRLLTEVKRAVAPALLLVEIEPKGRVHDWYVRNGFRLVSASYTQPALHADTSPVPFALYVSGESEERDELITALYKEAWQFPASHPFVRKALEA